MTYRAAGGVLGGYRLEREQGAGGGGGGETGARACGAVGLEHEARSVQARAMPTVAQGVGAVGAL